MFTQTFSSLLDFQSKFSTDQVCREYLEQIRWNGSVECPLCGHKEVYHLNDGKTYKCVGCTRNFTVTVGTVLENTKLPLTKWFMAMYLLTTHKKGISSCQLATDLNITQKSAWFLLHRLREMSKENNIEVITGFAEMDETYVGGKERNKHETKRTTGTTGRNTDTKTPVFAIKDRNTGHIQTHVVSDVKAKTLAPIIAKAIEVGSVVITDGFRSYLKLSDRYLHEVVKHNEGEFVRNNFHTNGVENFWSHFKRTIIGTYHQISPKHLQRYSDESAFRYNTRKLTQSERFNYNLKKCEGRLTYKDLISK